MSIRVALVGVGNCASSLIQGVAFYGRWPDAEGLMHPTIGPYKPSDIEFVGAFDVSDQKVGKPLSEAVFSGTNNTIQLAPGHLLLSSAPVLRGPTLDGVGRSLSTMVNESQADPVDVVSHLRAMKADVLVNYLPVGSTLATEFYAYAALTAGCAFVNCIPVFIAKNAKWQSCFEAANLPLIGDDIKSQVGATIVHRNLMQLFRERGMKVLKTYQLNFGGNTDFKNLLDKERGGDKKISKTSAVTAVHPMDAEDVHIGPSDYVQWLGDKKVAMIRIEAAGWGETPVICDLRLEVWDSPNSAGVVIDAVRCAKLAMDRKIGGTLNEVAAYLMKSPPFDFPDDEARRRLENFISG